MIINVLENNGDAYKNTVNISDGKITGDVYGALTINNGTAYKNTVEIIIAILIPFLSCLSTILSGISIIGVLQFEHTKSLLFNFAPQLVQ